MTQARALDDDGRVAGESYRSKHRQLDLPFVWQHGKMTAVALLSGIGHPPISTVSAMNDRGHVVGKGYTACAARGVVWTSSRP